MSLFEILQKNAGAIFAAADGLQSTELQTMLLDAPSTATLGSCTCVIVKPHAVKAKTFGEWHLCLFNYQSRE